MRECGGVLCNTVNCVIHLKRGWDGKEGRGNTDVKKGGGRAIWFKEWLP